MPSNLLRRFSQRHSALPSIAQSSLFSRTEVCPPQLWPSSITLWGRLQRWWLRDNPLLPESARPVNRLAAAKAEFGHTMLRVVGADADRLAHQIECARSLRELWHLRSSLYGLVAQQFDQADAERCMKRLNRHFPTRAPRSSFGALEP